MTDTRFEHFSIELDCAPGEPRPDTWLPVALRGTPFTPADFDCVSTFFGNWTFILRADAGMDDAYTEHRATIKENITQLYNSGAIRYGSW